MGERRAFPDLAADPPGVHGESRQADRPAVCLRAPGGLLSLYERPRALTACY